MISYEEYVYFRDIQGLKDSDVAKLASISQTTLSDWKRGKYSPKHEKMTQIERALGLRIEPDYKELGEILLNKPQSPDPIRKDEAELLKMYNSVNRAGQREIRRYAEYICTRDDLKKDASEGSSKIG